MNSAEFVKKIEGLIKSAKNKGLDNHMPSLSVPSGKLVELYGPMTDKILKDRAISKASELYTQYYVTTQNDLFQNAVHRIAEKVRLVPIEASNGAAEALASVHHLSTSFATNMNAAVGAVKPPPAGMSAVLLQFADSMITTALVFVPVAGPFLAPLSMGLGNALGYGMNAAGTAALQQTAWGQIPGFNLNANTNQQKINAKYVDGDPNNSDPSNKFTATAHQQDILDAGTSVGKANQALTTGVLTNLTDPNSVWGKAVAAKGLASLAAVFISEAVDRNYKSILKKAGDPSNSAFMSMMNSQSQNQVVAQKMQDIVGKMTLGRLDIQLPESLAATEARINKYENLNEKDTIKVFGTYNQKMFKDFLNLVKQVINAGVVNSFADATSKIHAGTLDDHHKIALLILGYFYSKDWNKTRQQDRDNRTQQSSLAEQQKLLLAQQEEQLKTSIQEALVQKEDADPLKLQLLNVQKDFRTQEGVIQSNKQFLDVYNAQKSGFTGLQMGGQRNLVEFTAAKGTLSKKSILSNFSNFAGRDDIGKLPILETNCLNYFENLKKAITADIASTMYRSSDGYPTDDKMQKLLKLYVGSLLIVNDSMSELELKTNSKMKKFGQALSKGSISINESYVKLIDDAGFIERYKGNVFGQVSKSKKETLAGTGKLRWSMHPSDTERAMLIAFCTVVAFNLDVGKIAIGMIDWDDALLALTDICKTISKAGVS